MKKDNVHLIGFAVAMLAAAAVMAGDSQGDGGQKVIEGGFAAVKAPAGIKMIAEQVAKGGVPNPSATAIGGAGGAVIKGGHQLGEQLGEVAIGEKRLDEVDFGKVAVEAGKGAAQAVVLTAATQVATQVAVAAAPETTAAVVGGVSQVIATVTGTATTAVGGGSIAATTSAIGAVALPAAAVVAVSVVGLKVGERITNNIFEFWGLQ